MPVIRGQIKPLPILDEQRKQVAEQLTKELSGERTENGPVIFEIPFKDQVRVDVLVVWNAWEPFTSSDRSDIILNAYKEDPKNASIQIAQALGVTHKEAIEQQILPYAVMPIARGSDIGAEDVKKAMVDEGGFKLDNGNIDLRFPTMSLAEEAHKRLVDKLPKGYWSIVQTL
jgi:hypothetical protein